MTNKIRPISFLEQLPSEVFEIILTFCEKKQLLNLLTVCSQFFPIVAKKLWSKQYMDFRSFRYFERFKNYRVGLPFRKNIVSNMPPSAPLLPYLNYVTELNLIEQYEQKWQVLILKCVSNCKKLKMAWSEAMASALLDTSNMVPHLSYLKLFGTSESLELKEGTKQLQAIIEARAETLKSLQLIGGHFCITQILFTIASKTKLIEFDDTPFVLTCDNKCAILSEPLFSMSSCLHYLSLNLNSLHTPLMEDFFKMIHSSSYLTTLKVSLKRDIHGPGHYANMEHFLHFLKKFPTSTPLKKLIVNYGLIKAPSFDEAPSVIDQVPMKLNSSLETLIFEFTSFRHIVPYYLLNFLLEKFSHLKCLEVFDRNPDRNVWDKYERGTLADHQSFLNRLTSLNLVKLKIKLPNNIRHFLLPSLICMTSLKELDLPLNLSLVYPYITQLTQLTRFIVRGIDTLIHLRVLIDKKPISLIKHRDHSNSDYYIFNKLQLDLIRYALSDSVTFLSVIDNLF